MVMQVVYTETFDAALDGNWVKRNITSESISGGAMTSVFGLGGMYYRSLANVGISDTSRDMMIEVEYELAAYTGYMQGPMFTDETGLGMQAAWYYAPSGMLLLTVNGFTYSSGFVNTGGVPSYPVWVRLKRSGDVHTAQWSFDGVTWTAPAVTYGRTYAPTRVGFGEILASGATAKVRSFKVWYDAPTPPVDVPALTVKAVSNGAALTWNAVEGATGYDLRVDGGATTDIGTAVPTGHTGTQRQAVLAGLTNGTPATIEVRAHNTSGNGPWGSVVVTPESSYLYDTFLKYTAGAFQPPLWTPTNEAAYAFWGGTGWTTTADGSGAQIQAGAVYRAAVVPGSADIDIEFIISTLGMKGVVFWGVDASNYWAVLPTAGGDVLLYRYVAGGMYQVYTWGGVKPAASDVWKVRTIGPLIVIFRNGKEFGSFETADESAKGSYVGLFSASSAGIIKRVLARPAKPNTVKNAEVRDLARIASAVGNGAFVYKGRDTKTADTGSVA